MVIYFQSINDIITSSSSEVFTIYNESSIETMKYLVNSILKAGGSRYEFDDLFTAELVLDMDRVKEDYENYGDKSITLEKFAKQHDDSCIDYGEGYPYIQGIKVIPKDLDNTKSFIAAGYLSELGNIFEKIILFT